MNVDPHAPVPTTALLPGEMKSPTAFRTISEVADNLGLPQHVLRFWESKFHEIKPLKRGGGRRYYRPEDVRIIHNIQDLLHNKGLTIRGVQKLLREGKVGAVRAAKPQAGFDPAQAQLAIDALAAVQDDLHDPAPAEQGLSPDKRRELQDVLTELKAMRKLLAQSGI